MDFHLSEFIHYLFLASCRILSLKQWDKDVLVRNVVCVCVWSCLPSFLCTASCRHHRGRSHMDCLQTEHNVDRCSCLKSEVSVWETVFWVGVGMERAGGAEPATALWNELHCLMRALKRRVASRSSFSCHPGKNVSITVTRLTRLAHGFWGKPQWPVIVSGKGTVTPSSHRDVRGPTYRECQGY